MVRHRRRGLAGVSRAPRRGDVYWVNLDPVVGTEIRKTRPAVVVSNDSCNRYGARVVVLPVTSNVKGKRGRPLGDQIRSIDKSRLKARVARLTADEMSRVDEALAITLGLPL